MLLIGLLSLRVWRFKRVVNVKDPVQLLVTMRVYRLGDLVCAVSSSSTSDHVHTFIDIRVHLIRCVGG